MKKLNGYRMLIAGELVKKGDEYTACGDPIDLPPWNEAGSMGWIPCLQGKAKGLGHTGHLVKDEDIERGYIHRRPLYMQLSPRPQTRRSEIATAIQVASREKRTAHETAAIISRIIDKHQKRAKRRAAK